MSFTKVQPVGKTLRLCRMCHRCVTLSSLPPQRSFSMISLIIPETGTDRNYFSNFNWCIHLQFREPWFTKPVFSWLCFEVCNKYARNVNQVQILYVKIQKGEKKKVWHTSLTRKGTSLSFGEKLLWFVSLWSRTAGKPDSQLTSASLITCGHTWRLGDIHFNILTSLVCGYVVVTVWGWCWCHDLDCRAMSWSLCWKFRLWSKLAGPPPGSESWKVRLFSVVKISGKILITQPGRKTRMTACLVHRIISQRVICDQTNWGDRELLLQQTGSTTACVVDTTLFILLKAKCVA